MYYIIIIIIQSFLFLVLSVLLTNFRVYLLSENRLTVCCSHAHTFNVFSLSQNIFIHICIYEDGWTENGRTHEEIESEWTNERTKESSNYSYSWYNGAMPCIAFTYEKHRWNRKKDKQQYFGGKSFHRHIYLSVLCILRTIRAHIRSHSHTEPMARIPIYMPSFSVSILVCACMCCCINLRKYSPRCWWISISVDVHTLNWTQTPPASRTAF